MSPYWVQGVRTLPFMCGNLGTGLEMNGKWAFCFQSLKWKSVCFWRSTLQHPGLLLCVHCFNNESLIRIISIYILKVLTLSSKLVASVRLLLTSIIFIFLFSVFLVCLFVCLFRGKILYFFAVLTLGLLIVRELWWLKSSQCGHDKIPGFLIAVGYWQGSQVYYRPHLLHEDQFLWIAWPGVLCGSHSGEG